MNERTPISRPPLTLHSSLRKPSQRNGNARGTPPSAVRGEGSACLPCAPAVGSAQHPSTSPSGGSIDLFARGDDDGPPATEVVESPAAAYDSAAKPAAATDDTAAATDVTAEPTIAAGDVTGDATAALTAAPGDVTAEPAAATGEINMSATAAGEIVHGEGEKGSFIVRFFVRPFGTNHTPIHLAPRSARQCAGIKTLALARARSATLARSLARSRSRSRSHSRSRSRSRAALSLSGALSLVSGLRCVDRASPRPSKEGCRDHVQ